MKPGDIWVTDIPQTSTHEQSGQRPAVVIARVTKTIVTIIPCTGNPLAIRFPFIYEITPSPTNGLSKTSVALIFHLRAIDVRTLKTKIGSLSKKDFSEIKKLAQKLIG